MGIRAEAPRTTVLTLLFLVFSWALLNSFTGVDRHNMGRYVRESLKESCTWDHYPEQTFTHISQWSDFQQFMEFCYVPFVFPPSVSAERRSTSGQSSRPQDPRTLILKTHKDLTVEY